MAKREAQKGAGASRQAPGGYSELEEGAADVTASSSREARAAAVDAIRDQGGKIGHSGISSDRISAMAKQREHDRLVGRAEELYRRKNEVPPIGLRSLNVEGLKRTVARLEQ